MSATLAGGAASARAAQIAARHRRAGGNDAIEPDHVRRTQRGRDAQMQAERFAVARSVPRREVAEMHGERLLVRGAGRGERRASGKVGAFVSGARRDAAGYFHRGRRHAAVVAHVDLVVERAAGHHFVLPPVDLHAEGHRRHDLRVQVPRRAVRERALGGRFQIIAVREQQRLHRSRAVFAALPDAHAIDHRDRFARGEIAQLEAEQIFRQEQVGAALAGRDGDARDGQRAGHECGPGGDEVPQRDALGGGVAGVEGEHADDHLPAGQRGGHIAEHGIAPRAFRLK